MSAREDAVKQWVDWDPVRLQRDQSEVAAFANSLKYVTPEPTQFPHGAWRGELPVWPFDRPEPEGLHRLVTTPLDILLLYSSAHPVVSPTIIPLNPEPAIHEVSDTIWHVAPGGSLCLFQSEGFWSPEASIVEILLKACGWRIEYALMHSGLISAMSERSIISDGSRDELITHAAAKLASGVSDG